MSLSPHRVNYLSGEHKFLAEVAAAALLHIARCIHLWFVLWAMHTHLPLPLATFHFSRAAFQLTSGRPCRTRQYTNHLCGSGSGTFSTKDHRDLGEGGWSPTPMSLLHVRRHQNGQFN